MKSFVKSIGVIDKNQRVHAVDFGPGINVVTGRSSTGKSALIEVFDYCFGSSEYTVPVGVITQNAAVYFTILRVNQKDIVLARKPSSEHALIREVNDETHLKDGILAPEFLEEGYYVALKLFKRQLASYFGLDVTHVEEEAKEYKTKKDPAPSVRSFTSFMLQHQNLVANKHAIFYRFDEQHEREQVIRHLDIFLGFADQKYFLLRQELDKYERDRKRLEFQLPRIAEVRAAAERDVTSLFDQFAAITGTADELGGAKQAVANPQVAFDKISKIRIKLLPLSSEHAKQRQLLEDQKAKLVASLRVLHNELGKVRASIATANRYSSDAVKAVIPETAEITVSHCPFCNSETHAVENAANRLTEALQWLNSDLRQTHYQLESFENAEKSLVAEIEAKESEIRAVDARISALDKVIEDLEEHRSQYELAIRSKALIEGALLRLLERVDGRASEELDALDKKIRELKAKLAADYDLPTKRARATDFINNAMSEIGRKFDFEDSYRPINLKFDLDTFDLWHEPPDGDKVFLRSMGSGANWLYSHLTLFMALHKYFCSLGPHCKIPTILFLDQPTQVYFPSVLDVGEKFEAEKISLRAQRNVDEDIRAVQNMFNQLIAFCRETEESTGVRPQIIITDHADHLVLADGISFESLVNGRRWREPGAGLINAQGGQAHR